MLPGYDYGVDDAKTLVSQNVISIHSIHLMILSIRSSMDISYSVQLPDRMPPWMNPKQTFGVVMVNIRRI